MSILARLGFGNKTHTRLARTILGNANVLVTPENIRIVTRRLSLSDHTGLFKVTPRLLRLIPLIGGTERAEVYDQVSAEKLSAAQPAQLSGLTGIVPEPNLVGMAYPNSVPVCTDQFLNISKHSYPLPWLVREIVQNFVDGNVHDRGTLNGVSLTVRDGEGQSKIFEITGKWRFKDLTGLTSLHSGKAGTSFNLAGGNGIGLKQTILRFLRDYNARVFNVEGEGWIVKYELVQAATINSRLEAYGVKGYRVEHDWLIATVEKSKNKGRCTYLIEAENHGVEVALSDFLNTGVSNENEFLEDPDFINEYGAIKWLEPASSEIPKGRLYINGQVMNFKEKGRSVGNYWQGPEFVSVQLNAVNYEMTLDRLAVNTFDLERYVKKLLDSMSVKDLADQITRSEHIWTSHEEKKYSLDRWGCFVIIEELVDRLYNNAHYHKNNSARKCIKQFATYYEKKKYLYKDESITDEQVKELKKKGYSICPAYFKKIGMSSASSKLDLFDAKKNERPTLALEKMREIAEKYGIPVAFEDLSQLRTPADYVAALMTRLGSRVVAINARDEQKTIFRVSIEGEIATEDLAHQLPNPKTDSQKLLYFFRGFVFYGLTREWLKEGVLSQGEYITTFDQGYDEVSDELILLARNVKMESTGNPFVEVHFNVGAAEQFKQLIGEESIIKPALVVEAEPDEGVADHQLDLDEIAAAGGEKPGIVRAEEKLKSNHPGPLFVPDTGEKSKAAKKGKEVVVDLPEVVDGEEALPIDQPEGLNESGVAEQLQPLPSSFGIGISKETREQAMDLVEKNLADSVEEPAGLPSRLPDDEIPVIDQGVETPKATPLIVQKEDSSLLLAPEQNEGMDQIAGDNLADAPSVPIEAVDEAEIENQLTEVGQPDVLNESRGAREGDLAAQIDSLGVSVDQLEKPLDVKPAEEVVEPTDIIPERYQHLPPLFNDEISGDTREQALELVEKNLADNDGGFDGQAEPVVVQKEDPGLLLSPEQHEGGDLVGEPGVPTGGTDLAEIERTEAEIERELRGLETLRNMVMAERGAVEERGSEQEDEAPVEAAPAEKPEHAEIEVNLPPGGFQHFSSLSPMELTPMEDTLAGDALGQKNEEPFGRPDTSIFDENFGDDAGLERSIGAFTSLVDAASNASSSGGHAVEQFEAFQSADQSYGQSEMDTSQLEGKSIEGIVDDHNRAAISESAGEEADPLAELEAGLIQMADMVADASEAGVEDFKIIESPSESQVTQLRLLRLYFSHATGVELPNELFIFSGTGKKAVNIKREAIGLHESLFNVAFLEVLASFVHEVAHNEVGPHDLSFIYVLESLFVAVIGKLQDIGMRVLQGETVLVKERFLFNIYQDWESLRVLEKEDV